MNYELIIKPYNKENKFILVEDFVIGEIKIKKGFISNGANIPRFLWWWISPFKPSNLRAVFVHDYLCDMEEYKRADAEFSSILLEDDTFNHRAMLLGVMAWHWVRYKKYRSY